MRKLVIAPLFVLLFAAASAMNHKKNMDAAQEWKEELRDALNARSSTKAAALAGKLVRARTDEADYWRIGGVKEAVKLALENASAARQVEAAAKAGRFPEATEAFGRLEATCRTCHDLHPEKQLPLRKW